MPGNRVSYLLSPSLLTATLQGGVWPRWSPCHADKRCPGYQRNGSGEKRAKGLNRGRWSWGRLFLKSFTSGCLSLISELLAVLGFLKRGWKEVLGFDYPIPPCGSRGQASVVDLLRASGLGTPWPACVLPVFCYQGQSVRYPEMGSCDM